MIRVTHQRNKCIGCNYCVELAVNRWKMSKKDGKSTLLGSIQKKDFHISVVGNDEYEALKRAANACPTKIIRVEQIA